MLRLLREHLLREIVLLAGRLDHGARRSRLVEVGRYVVAVAGWPARGGQRRLTEHAVVVRRRTSAGGHSGGNETLTIWMFEERIVAETGRLTHTFKAQKHLCK